MSDEFFPRDNRQPRHFWADNEIIDRFGAKLGAQGIAVYMALARSAMNNSGQCRTSMRKIAVQIGVSPGSVFNALTTILQLGLARKTEEGDNRHCAAYVLADVKALTDPNHAQLRLSASVHLLNAETSQRSPIERSVHPENAERSPVERSVHLMNAHKEDKTFLQDLQNDLQDSGICSKCKGKGFWGLKGHPGRQVYCTCPVGAGLQKREKAIQP